MSNGDVIMKFIDVEPKYNNPINGELRNILKIYLNAPAILSQIQKSFYNVAMHYGTPTEKAINWWIRTEEEIKELKKTCRDVDLFIESCTDDEKQIINYLLDGVSLEQMHKEMNCSSRTIYRKFAKISKRFFEEKNLREERQWQKERISKAKQEAKQLEM